MRALAFLALLVSISACSESDSRPAPVTVTEANLTAPERPKAEQTKLSDPGPMDVGAFSLDGRILEFPTQDEADALAERRIGLEDFDAELAKLRFEIERGH